MPSPLAVLLTEIEGHIGGFSGLTFATGPLKVQANASPPRISWVQTGGSIEPTSRVGGKGALPRALWADAQRVDVHIWGTNSEQVALLTDAVLRACNRAAAGSYTPGSYEDTTTQDADQMRRGVKRVLTIVFRRAVTEAAPTVAQVDSFPFDSSQAVAGDGVIEAGES